MNSEPTLDPIELQRLIDGELSSIEVRELVEKADRNPALWRSIGCAFTEDQMFRQQFESLTDETEQSKPAMPVQHLATTNQKPPKSLRSTPLVWQLTTAACFALAGLVGYLIGSEGSSPTSDIPSSNMIANNSNSDAGNTSALTPVDLKPEYRMELLTPDGESVDGEVDLYRYNDLHRLVGNDGSDRRVKLKDVLPSSGFSPEARQRLSQSGYDINETTNYMSGRLQDGRKFVVPVRSIRFDQGH